MASMQLHMMLQNQVQAQSAVTCRKYLNKIRGILMIWFDILIDTLQSS